MTKRSIAIVLLAMSAACGDDGGLAGPAPLDVAKLFPAPPSCRRSRDHAAARAEDLERTADARWERVPFAREEAATAVVEMTEAESCFQLSGDRAGRLRAQNKRKVFEHEVVRRFAKARLNLDVAVRLKQPERAKREADEMVALLSRSEDHEYRESLGRLSRAYAAAVLEDKAQEER